MVRTGKQVRDKCSFDMSELSLNDFSQVFSTGLLGDLYGYSQEQWPQELFPYSVEEKLGMK